MFLRTTSKAFAGSKKGTAFRHNLGQSFQFGGHRAVIADSAFSYYGLYTAGYTFVAVAETPLVNWMNRFIPIDYNKVAESLFTGIGLVAAGYNFDGSGDSGDFDEDEMSFSNGLNMNILLNSRGLCDSSDPNHCLHMRNPTRRDWRNNAMVEIRGGTRTTADNIEYCAYNALESEYGGWENNAGANGTVHIMTGQNLIINYNPGSYYCDRCDEEYDDETSCSCPKCPACYDYVDDDGKCESCEQVVKTCNGCTRSVAGDEFCSYCKPQEIAK